MSFSKASKGYKFLIISLLLNFMENNPYKLSLLIIIFMLIPILFSLSRRYSSKVEKSVQIGVVF